MLAWLLIVWTGGHTGYYTVPAIASEQACHQLYAEIKREGFYAPAVLFGKPYLCVSYQTAR